MQSFNEFRGSQIDEASENLPGKATHILNKDVRHPEHGIVQNGTVLRKTGEDEYEIRAGRARGKIAKIGKDHVNVMEEVELEESPIEKAPRKFSGMHDKVTAPGMRTPEERKKLKDAAKAINARSKKQDLPFTPDEPHKPVATAGKYGSGYSTARHLARQGMKDVQKEEVVLEEEITPVQSAAARQKLKQIEKSGVKKSQELYNKLTRIANAHPVKEEVDLEEDKTPAQKRDFKNMMAGAMSRDEYNKKHSLGKYAEKSGKSKLDPTGVYHSMIKTTNEEVEMSQMDKYLAAISGNADFRTSLEEKTLTPAELKKREEIAQAIERENPGMDMGKKMAIATAQAKKVAEEAELDEAISDADKETMKKRVAMARPELEKTKDVTRKFGGGEKGAKNVEQGFRSAIKRDYKKMDEEVVEEGKSHTVPKTEKEKDLAAIAEPKDKITHADVLKGRGVTKEDVEMKSYSQLMAELEEAKKDDYWDFKDLKDEPKSTTRKVAGTRYGGSAQKDEPEQDDEDDKPAVKRGRGRPAGSKSGARH